MASIEEVFYSKANNNKIGTLESVLSGVASGLIAIPKGFFFFRCNSFRSWC